jgi:hypothetical protein
VGRLKRSRDVSRRTALDADPPRSVDPSEWGVTNLAIALDPLAAVAALLHLSLKLLAADGAGEGVLGPRLVRFRLVRIRCVEGRVGQRVPRRGESAGVAGATPEAASDPDTGQPVR